MELVTMTGKMMPNGNPLFEIVKNCPAITQLVHEYGRKTVLKVLYLLVKDLCNTLNVVRNMNNDQMIEAAAMLLDECDNFRLEDYTMMFALGKRGQLVKIMDRVDMDMISGMMDAYWHLRLAAAYRLQQQEIEKEDWSKPIPAPETDAEKAMSAQFGKLVGIMKVWEDTPEEKKKKQEDFSARRIAGYEALQKVNMPEVVKQFSKDKKK